MVKVIRVHIIHPSGTPARAVTGQRQPPERWAEGYSQSELEDAQARYGLIFPPDLVALLHERRPLQGYDWRTDHDAIVTMLKRPFEGLLYDVEHNGLWEFDWGERPQTQSGRREALAAVVASAPRLIPLLSHRYLPEEPSEAGNPVLSVVQSDIIYYGANLTDYFDREFGGFHQPIDQPIRRIRFWSDLID